MTLPRLVGLPGGGVCSARLAFSCLPRVHLIASTKHTPTMANSKALIKIRFGIVACVVTPQSPIVMAIISAEKLKYATAKRNSPLVRESIPSVTPKPSTKVNIANSGCNPKFRRELGHIDAHLHLAKVASLDCGELYSLSLVDSEQNTNLLPCLDGRRPQTSDRHYGGNSCQSPHADR